MIWVKKINLTEEGLEDIIYDIYLAEELKMYFEDFASEPFACKRQLNLGNYGISDLIFIEKDLVWHGAEVLDSRLFVHVFELKARPIEAKDVVQVCRYSKAIERYLLEHRDSTYFEVFPHLLFQADSNYPQEAYISDFSHIKFWQYSFDRDGMCVEKIDDLRLKNEFGNED